MTRARLTASAAVLALSLTVGALYTTRLSDAPIYLVHDEVMFALQSHSLYATGRDLVGQRIPLFFAEPEFKAGRDPISIYLTAFLLKFLPFSESTVRLPTALVGVVTVIAMWVLARRIFKREFQALVAAGVLALTPAYFIYSRMALDVVYPLVFTIAWLWCLLVFLERGEPKTLFCATLALGLGIYSYLGFLAMTPVYLLMTAYALAPRRSIRSCLVAAGGFLLPVLPLFAWQLAHPDRYAVLASDYHVKDSTHMRAWVDTYWNYFNPSFLFFSGDSSIVNSTRQAGVFLLPLIALVPLGVYHILKNRRTRFNELLVLGLISSPFAATVLATIEIRRAMVMIPFAVLIAAFGVDFLLSAPKRVWHAVALVLLLLVPIQFRSFYADYLGDYRIRAATWLGGNIRGGVIAVLDRTRGTETPVYLSAAIPYIAPYWKFYAIARGRADLTDRAVYYDPEQLDVGRLQAGTVLLNVAGEARTEAKLNAGGWTKAQVISEPDGHPSFEVYQK
jgi:4-amino-4-deoxy-L-arabinose transferase-like glycosyltransferase